MFVFIISAVVVYFGIKFVFAVRAAMKAERAKSEEPRRKRALDFKW